MKWKLTGNYLVSILAIVAIVVILNVVILVALLVNQRTGIDDVESNSGETFTRTFNQYMTLEDGEPVVSPDGVRALEANNAFLQVLDASGRVTRATLSGSSGDPGIDAAIREEILTGLKFQAPPPDGMPMPIVMRLKATRPN